MEQWLSAEHIDKWRWDEVRQISFIDHEAAIIYPIETDQSKWIYTIANYLVLGRTSCRRLDRARAMAMAIAS
jgi:hypothetical protein